MRITQLVLLAAAMLWTTLGLSAAAWAGADQTAGASAEGSVENIAPYDEVLDSEGLFRHWHARLMRLHHLAMERGRVERAREIERLVDHLGEGHVRSLRSGRTKVHQAHQAHIDELIREHHKHREQVNAELKARAEHARTTLADRRADRRRDVADQHRNARQQRTDRHRVMVGDHRDAHQRRAERRSDVVDHHRDAHQRRTDQRRDAASDRRDAHQRRAERRSDVASRHHDAPHPRADGRRDGARPDNDERRHRTIMKPRRDEVDRRSDAKAGKSRTARAARFPSHREAKEQAERTIKPEDADRVFEQLRREIKRKR
ncbi:MAG: hypothetical protein V3T84_11820 [Phycisphaerales bacterium]